MLATRRSTTPYYKLQGVSLQCAEPPGAIRRMLPVGFMKQKAMRQQIEKGNRKGKRKPARNGSASSPTKPAYLHVLDVGSVAPGTSTYGPLQFIAELKFATAPGTGAWHNIVATKTAHYASQEQDDYAINEWKENGNHKSDMFPREGKK